ncbi:MAG: DUF421 domain-containing protein [Lachnospiraceae bacterium]|nr:DUF421 domain-containing protein [Lachnospiraceae bacterium]
MYLQVFIHTLVSIIVLFLLAKWIGCRQISQMSIFDYINGITIGSIAAEVAMTKDNVIEPLIAMTMYAAATVLLSFISEKSMKLRRVIIGRPYVLYHNDRFYYENMKKNKIDLHEFLMAARSDGYFDLSEIQDAVLECNGKISFLPKSENRPVTPKDLKLQPEKSYVFSNVIMEGKIMPDNLRHIGRDEKWLSKQMDIHAVKDIKNVFLAICDGNNNCFFFEKEKSTNKKDTLV